MHFSSFEVDLEGKQKKNLGLHVFKYLKKARSFVKFLKLFYIVSLKFFNLVYVTFNYFFHELISMQKKKTSQIYRSEDFF
jgi:hypothetical protein